MNISEKIIEKFGGLGPMTDKLSEALGERIPKTTVQYWGVVGHIPARRQADVMRAAEHHGIELSPDDFFEPTAAGTEKTA